MVWFFTFPTKVLVRFSVSISKLIKTVQRTTNFFTKFRRRISRNFAKIYDKDKISRNIVMQTLQTKTKSDNNNNNNNNNNKLPWNLCLLNFSRNFAKLLVRNFAKFCELNFNFVFREMKKTTFVSTLFLGLQKFWFDIETKTYHQILLRFDIETICCGLFNLYLLLR
jgi:hypothetical protein